MLFRSLEDIATVMPVALVPGPSGSGETTLGWAPIVPLAIVPFVPDLLFGNPLPSVLGGLGVSAPVANLWQSSVFVDKFKAGSLGSKNLSVLSVDLSLGLSVVLLVGVLVGTFVFFVLDFEKGLIVD